MKRMMIIGIVAGLLALGISAYLLWGLSRPFAGAEGEITVRGVRFAVDIAESPMERAQGLSGRAGLEENEGMLFLFGTPGEQGFWMKDMDFPIDIVWIREGKIVGASENAAPEPEKNLFQLRIYRSPGPVDTVLEVSAGTVAKYGFTAGDEVRRER